MVLPEASAPAIVKFHLCPILWKIPEVRRQAVEMSFIDPNRQDIVVTFLLKRSRLRTSQLVIRPATHDPYTLERSRQTPCCNCRSATSAPVCLAALLARGADALVAATWAVHVTAVTGSRLAAGSARSGTDGSRPSR